MKAEEKFISEAISPIAGTFDTGAMSRGEPGLPAKFIWRDSEYEIAHIMDKWKETSPCKSGGKEKYVRKHWYVVKATNGIVMKLYFERKPLSKGQRKLRWWLYSIIEG